MLGLNFEGWCQVRLATNPDPSDEPRGVSGYSFALAGEPDLDRVIRFHDPVAPRSFAPSVGVFVRSVSVRGRSVPDHPLCGAAVTLLNSHGRPPARPTDPDGPKFEARNYIMTQPGEEPIHPFHIHFEKDGTTLARSAVLYPEHPEVPFYEIPWENLKRFGAVSFVMDSADVAEATGIYDYAAYRAQRRVQVQGALQEATDPIQVAALRKRLAELEKPVNVSEDPARVVLDRRVVALGACQSRNFELTGPATVVDRQEVLGPIDTARSWRTEFWFGAWDCDALTCFVKGNVVVPFVPDNAPAQPPRPPTGA